LRGNSLRLRLVLEGEEAENGCAHQAASREELAQIGWSGCDGHSQAPPDSQFDCHESLLDAAAPGLRVEGEHEAQLKLGQLSLPDLIAVRWRLPLRETDVGSVIRAASSRPGALLVSDEE